MTSRRIIHDWGLPVASGAVAVYFLILYTLSPVKLYDSFGILNFDFGIHFQTAYLWSRFDELFLTVRGVHALADNQHYFLAVFALLQYLPYPHYATLIFYSLGIYACGLICLLYLQNKDPFAALAIAMFVWLSPFLINMNLDVFQPEAFSTLFILCLYAACKRGRSGFFYIFLLLALSCKEDIALTVGLFMLLSLCTKDRFKIPRAHLSVGLVISILLFMVNLKIVLPYYKMITCLWLNPEFPVDQISASPVARTFHDVFSNWYRFSFLKERFIRAEVGWYILKVMWPLVFFIKSRSIFFLLPAVPLIINILAKSAYLTQGYYHYDHCTIAAVIIAVMESLNGTVKKKLPCTLLLVTAIIISCFMTKLRIPVYAGLTKDFYCLAKSDSVRVLEALNDALPENTTISADYRSINYLIHGHPVLYMFDNPFRTSYRSFGILDECVTLRSRPIVDFVVLRNGTRIDDEMRGRLTSDFRCLSHKDDMFWIWVNPTFFKSARASRFRDYIQEVVAQQKTLCKPPNLLINGGFETASGLLPAKWTLETWRTEAECPGCRYGVDPFIKKGGFISAKSNHSDVNISRWIQEVAVKPDTEYLLSGWIKTERVSMRGTGALIQAEGIRESSSGNASEVKKRRKDVLARTEPVSGTNEWQYVEIQFKTGKRHRKLEVFCGLGDYGAHTAGTAFFDDIQLREVPTSYLCGVFGNYPDVKKSLK